MDQAVFLKMRETIQLTRLFLRGGVAVMLKSSRIGIRSGSALLAPCHEKNPGNLDRFQ